MVFVIFRARDDAFSTRLGLPADTISLVATAVAMLISHWDDQHAIRPSMILTLYWSALTVLGIPRLRTVWLKAETMSPLPILWTLVFIATVIVLAVELVPKTRYLNSQYQSATPEELCDVWSWALFLWILPFLRTGFSQILAVRHLPPIDASLQATEALARLRARWDVFPLSMKGSNSHILLRAMFRAYLIPFVTAIIPRLCLSAFTFSQPFLITTAVTYFEQDTSADTVYIGRALIGASALVYLGIAVRLFSPINF
jgi:ATP-binding cassette subfamily C (CFTR/MRP) protein 1